MMVCVVTLCIMLCSCEFARFENSKSEEDATSSQISKEVSNTSSNLTMDESFSPSSSETTESDFQSEPTESELMEAHLQRVYAMLDECRPEEAYQFPDFSGEITDVRITVRERAVDGSFWNADTDRKTYDIFYGYLFDGVWYDFPSCNYDLKDFSEKYPSGWWTAETCHVVEIGQYILFAYPVGAGITTKTLPTVEIEDSLNSPIIEVLEYYNMDKDACVHWHFFENMRDYNTANYDFYMKPFNQWYFIILEKSALTEDYRLSVSQDWEESIHDKQKVYTYDEIMQALNR